MEHFTVLMVLIAVYTGTFPELIGVQMITMDQTPYAYFRQLTYFKFGGQLHTSKHNYHIMTIAIAPPIKVMCCACDLHTCNHFFL